MKLMGVGHPGAALGEGGVDFGVVPGVLQEMFALAESKDGVFQRAGAVEAPAVLADGLGEIELESADGGEGFADSIAPSFLARTTHALCALLKACSSSGVWMMIWPVRLRVSLYPP